MTVAQYARWLLNEHELEGHITAQQKRRILRDIKASEEVLTQADDFQEGARLVLKRIAHQLHGRPTIPHRRRQNGGR